MSQFHDPYIARFSWAGFENLPFLQSVFLDQYCKISDCKIFDTCLTLRSSNKMFSDQWNVLNLQYKISNK